MSKQIPTGGDERTPADESVELELRLRGELNIKFSYLARANNALTDITGASLAQTVEAYPRVVNLHYRASNEAADHMSIINTRMGRIERRHRRSILSETMEVEKKGEKQTIPKFANDTARADELADRLDADAEYQVLLSLHAECEQVKIDAALDGDQLRRELYNMREAYFQELRRFTIELEHTRRVEAARL
jgi:hypothetical protein